MDFELIGTESGFCAATADIWQIIGYIIMIFKIVIPGILIVIGIISLGKAVVSTDDKDIKKAVSSLIKKFIYAICIFFVPQIVTALFGIVSGFREIKSDYKVCETCMINPRGISCNKYVLSINNNNDELMP